MKSDCKIILLELNEVPYKIWNQFCQQFPGSSLAKFDQKCQHYVSQAEDTGHLSPWVTWPSLHRGVTNTIHGIRDFGQNLRDINQKYPSLWEILAKSGVSTGIFGSLHSYPMPTSLTSYKFYVPDTFAPDSTSYPQYLSAFQDLNLTMARNSARNVSTSIPATKTLQMVAKMPWLGITLHSVFQVVSQLVEERFKPYRRVRRRSFQGLLSFDCFMKQMAKEKPDFATFFTNHVASAMHRYWAAAFPEDYSEIFVTDDWIEMYRHEIDFAMQVCDRMFLKLMNFVDRHPEYEIWVASSMGQAATVAEFINNQLYMVEPNKFMDFIGFAVGDWSKQPAMLPQTNLVIASEKVSEFRKFLKGFKINDRPIGFREKEGGFFSLDFGHYNIDINQLQIEIEGRKVSPDAAGLALTEIEDRAGATAYHVREGIFMIYNSPENLLANSQERISTLEIAPMILQKLGVPIPSYMRTPKYQNAEIGV